MEKSQFQARDWRSHNLRRPLEEPIVAAKYFILAHTTSWSLNRVYWLQTEPKNGWSRPQHQAFLMIPRNQVRSSGKSIFSATPRNRCLENPTRAWRKSWENIWLNWFTWKIYHPYDSYIDIDTCYLHDRYLFSCRMGQPMVSWTWHPPEAPGISPYLLPWHFLRRPHWQHAVPSESPRPGPNRTEGWSASEWWNTGGQQVVDSD